MEEEIKKRKINENLIEETKKSHSMMIQTLKEEHALEIEAGIINNEPNLVKYYFLQPKQSLKKS